MHEAVTPGCDATIAYSEETEEMEKDDDAMFELSEIDELSSDADISDVDYIPYDHSEGSVERSSGEESDDTCSLHASMRRVTLEDHPYTSCDVARDEATSFSLCWDNTQKNIHARDQSREHGNKMLLWANAYAALNRVDKRDLDYMDQTLRASDLMVTNDPAERAIKDVQDCAQVTRDPAHRDFRNTSEN